MPPAHNNARGLGWLVCVDQPTSEKSACLIEMGNQGEPCDDSMAASLLHPTTVLAASEKLCRFDFFFKIHR